MIERTDLNAQVSGEDATLERSAEEIRHDIAAKRQSLSKTVDRLDERIHQTLDWREDISDHPYAALGIATGLGFLIWGIFRPRPTSRERIMEALAESAEGLSDRFLRETGSDLPVEKESGLGRAVKATVTTAATKAALDLLSRGIRGSLQRAPRGAE